VVKGKDRQLAYTLSGVVDCCRNV